MKLGTCMFLGAAGLMSLGLMSAASVEGCSSSTSSSSDGGVTGTSGDGGSTGTTGATGTGAVPSSPSGASATTSTTPHNFALHHIHLGDETGTSWQQYGYNIDGKTTTATSTDVCTQVTGASKKNQADGTNGIDNSFGENIIPLLAAVAPNPSATIDTSITAGKFSIMMNITGLSGTAGQNATGLTGQLFAAVHFNQGPNSATSVPTFTTSDNWPLDPSYITSAIGTDANLTLVQPVTSKINFTGAYVVGGTFVSGSPTSVSLALSISGVTLTVPVQHATLTFSNPGANGSATNAASGIISGVIDAATLVANIGGVAGAISTSLCSGSALQQINSSILEAADIMDDGTNAAGTTCNGISIGIGFDADEIAQPTNAGVPTTSPNPCGDGGSTSTPDDAGATDQ